MISGDSRKFRETISVRLGRSAYGRKSQGTLCSLPRKFTTATPGGVKVNLADKIIFSYH